MSLYKINTITCTVPALKCGTGSALNDAYAKISESCADTPFKATEMSNWCTKVTLKLVYSKGMVATYSSNGFPHIVGSNSIEDIHTLISDLKKLYAKAGVCCELKDRPSVDD